MKSAGIVLFMAGLALLSTVAPAQQSPAGVLSGIVHPAGASVTLISATGQRATVSTARDGRYEFGALSDGNYVLQATAPGYKSDSLEVRIVGERHASQNLRLLYISLVDGIDWSRGIISATGSGKYPADASSRSAAREMAKRAALSDAERNLLAIIEQVRIGPAQDLASLVAGGDIIRIRGYLQGFRVVSERETGSGVEVELEIPLTGRGGLTRYISD